MHDQCVAKDRLIQNQTGRRIGYVALALIVAVVLAYILPSTAGATVVAYPKPPFTKTAGNATFAFHWTNDLQSAPYWLCGDVFVNGIDVDPSEFILGPGSRNCSEAMTAPSGDWVVQPFDPSTVLQDGTTYDTCVADYTAIGGIPFPASEPPDCVATTIDRDVPTLQVVLGGGAASTQSIAVPVEIDYSSPVSPPWPGAGGVASNWDCSNLGTACTPTGSPDAICSHPENPLSRTTAFSCILNLSGASSNGTYYFCVIAADSAVPDNPTSTDQLQNAASNNANVSAPACGHITLNRNRGGGTSKSGTSGGATHGRGGSGSGSRIGRCVVPKVTGRSVTSAKVLIKRRGCRVGRVTKRRGRRMLRGHVVAESPPAGRKLAAGTAINLVISR